jgi:molybdenum cofactor biosynthesis enzyme MoaA
MATTQKWARGTADTLLSTELNSIANNTNAIKSSSVTLTTESYVLAEVELRVQFCGTPTANTSVSVLVLNE